MLFCNAGTPSPVHLVQDKMADPPHVVLLLYGQVGYAVQHRLLEVWHGHV